MNNKYKIITAIAIYVLGFVIQLSARFMNITRPYYEILLFLSAIVGATADLVLANGLSEKFKVVRIFLYVHAALSIPLIVIASLSMYFQW